MKTIELETAKKLKELGLKNKSFSFWRLRNGGEEKGYKITHDTINANYLKNNKDILYMAYTLDEILEMLPAEIITCRNEYELILGKDVCDNEPAVSYTRFEADDDYSCMWKHLAGFGNKNPAEAAGQLLIWCIENGHVKIEDINNAMV